MEENKLGNLSDKLIEIINNRSNPFTKIKVLVPSYSLESYFKTYWLKHNKNNVLMNVYFYTVDDLINEFLKPWSALLSNDLITLYVLNELSLNKDSYKKLNTYYLSNDSINYNKLYDLSKMLSDLYIKYEDDLFDYKSSSVYKNDEEKLFEVIENKSRSNNVITRKELINELKIAKDNYVSFGFNKYTPLEEVLIKKLSIEDNHNLKLKNSEKINDLKIISAPSKIREIEGIHTEMCNILLKDGITYSDIVVLTPKISDYRTIIRQIFHQDNEDFPSLTRSVNSEANIETDITRVLNKLKEIVKKEYYSSLDFIDLISIPLIKKNRHLNDDDINIIKDVLVNLNIKRENTKSETINDFTYLKTRLLINQVLDINISDHNTIDINSKKYIPFNSISLTDSIISVLVDTINDLNNIIKFYQECNESNKVDMESFKNHLSTWFSNLDSEGGEKNSDFQELLNKLDNYNNIINNNLSLDVLLDYLKDVSLSKEGTNDKYYLNGITFANFDKDALLEAKYIFLIGCDTNSLNTDLVISELDIREHSVLKEKYKKELEDAFINQASLAEQKVFISYVSEDLKTDEEIYPSNLIDNVIKEKENLNTLNEYVKKYENDKDKYEKIPLDETRSNNLLFTRREFINKGYFEELRGVKVSNSLIKPNPANQGNKTKEDIEKIDNSSNQIIVEVKLNDLRGFLDEPYSFWIAKLFGREDETNDKLNDEFESLSIDNLSSYNIVKDLTLSKFKESSSDKVKEKYTLENKIPLINDAIKDSLFDKEKQKAEALCINKNGYKVVLFDDTLVENKYLIKVSNEILIKEENNEVYLSLIKSKSDKFKDFLELYLYSLLYAYNKGEYTFHLVTDCKEAMFKDVTLSQDDAKTRLINIIEKMFKSINNLKFFKYDKLSQDNDTKDTSEYKYLNVKLLGSGGVYEYFGFKDLLDTNDVPGFSDENDAKDTIKEYKEFFDENICGNNAGE